MGRVNGRRKCGTRNGRRQARGSHDASDAGSDGRSFSPTGFRLKHRMIDEPNVGWRQPPNLRPAPRQPSSGSIQAECLVHFIPSSSNREPRHAPFPEMSRPRNHPGTPHFCRCTYEFLMSYRAESQQHCSHRLPEISSSWQH